MATSSSINNENDYLARLEAKKEEIVNKSLKLFNTIENITSPTLGISGLNSILFVYLSQKNAFLKYLSINNKGDLSKRTKYLRFKEFHNPTYGLYKKLREKTSSLGGDVSLFPATLEELSK
jgi:hypothetical protein